MPTFKNIEFLAAILIMALSIGQLSAQHRGDNLRFQGLDMVNTNGVKSQAMGGAYSSISGDLESVYWNPAGIIGIKGFQFSINANSYQKKWWERQDYRPNRQVVTMSFILDGLYSPPDSTNNMLDHEAFLRDTVGNYYNVNTPELGKDPFGEEGADWVESLSKSGLNNIAAAFPFEVLNRSFVISGYLSNNILVDNYDRNETYLDPHPTSSDYNAPERVTQQGDSVRINWYDFARYRKGPLQKYNVSLAVNVSKYLSLGLGFNRLMGQTKDWQVLKKVAYFDLIDNYNTFKFSYDTSNTSMKGTSDFSLNSFTVGGIFKFKNIRIGAVIEPGGTLKREWENTTIISNNIDTSRTVHSGMDKMKIPTSYTLGISLLLKERVTISMDYVNKPYANSEFTLANPDSAHRNWKNQNYFRFGIAYQPVSFITVMGGYRGIPQVFVPDGNAIKDRGPIEESYSLGMAIRLLMGQLSFAYETRKLKFYDAYFSNMNYNTQNLENFLVGYTITL